MRAVTSLFACGLALALVGCGDSHEKVIADQVDVLSDMNDVLGGVTDKASAEAAAPELKALGERAENINARAEKLSPPSQEQLQAIREKHKEQFEKEFGRMFANMMRLAEKPEVMAAVQNAMPDIGEGPDWLNPGPDMSPAGGEMQFDMPDMPEMPQFPEGPELSTPDFPGREATPDQGEQP